MSFIYGEELHPPYYNFMGPSTKIEDRISLNYKRKGQGPLGIKKGTLSFWIPSTVSDLVSLEHDLMYYSPNNYIRALADWNYLKDVESDIGTLGIGLQFIKRFGVESVPILLQGEALRKAIVKSLDKLIEIGTGVFTEVKTERQLNEQAVDEVLQPLENAMNIWNELTGGQGRNILGVDLNEIRRYPAQQQLVTIMKELAKATPYLIGYGLLGYKSIVPKMKKLYNQMNDYVYQTDEYKKMIPYMDEIKDNLFNYLNEVGSFKDPKDLPLSKKIFHIGMNFDRPFVPKEPKDIDREKARSYYIKYFEAFEKYAKFMNERHKNNPEYEKFNLKPLDMERLPMVSAPTGLTQENLNDIILFNQTIGDPVIDPNEKMEKIEAILAGKSLPEDRPKEEISTEDKPFSFDIPLGDYAQFMKDLEEIEKQIKEGLARIEKDEL